MLELELNDQEPEIKSPNAEVKPLEAEMSASETTPRFAPEFAPRFETAAPTAESPETAPDFLDHYEVGKWTFSPRLYKILAASLAVNLLFIAVVAQGDLLRTRACDSPFVGKVCQVLDTVYIGSVLLGTDTEYTSSPYEKTMIEDSDDVIFNNLSGTDPVAYPDGYFALANPEQYQVVNEAAATSDGFPYVSPPPIAGFPNFKANPPMNNPTIISPPMPKTITRPPFPNVNGGGVLSKKPKYPRPNNQGIKNLPGSIDDEDPLAAVNNPTGKKGKPGDDKDKTKPDADKTVAQNDNPAKTDPVEEKDGFNQQPIEDFGNKYSEPILKKEIDINAPFEVVVTTKLDENGKFIKPTMTTKEGSDPKMAEMAKDAIAAFSDSKLLKPLYDVGVKDVKITFAQDKDNLQVIISTLAPTPERAKSLSSLIGAFLKSKPPKEGSDEAVLLSQDKLQFATQDKMFIINFAISNDEKSAMVFKNLQKLQEKAKNQSNKSAESENSSQLAAGK